MSRMFDRLMANGIRVIPWLREMQTEEENSFLQGLTEKLTRNPPVIVDASNVAKYFFEITDQETWDLSVDFPSMAPPWPFMFVEFSAPARISSCEYGTAPVDTGLWGTHRGVLIESLERTVLPWGRTPFPDQARWAQLATTFIEFGAGDCCMIGTQGWYVRPDGTVIDEKNCWISVVVGTNAIGRRKGDAEQRKVADGITKSYQWPSVYAAALTLSFINCRNTVLVDHIPDPKLARANARRGRPHVTYKTLQIEPLKQLLSAKGNSEQVGLKQALHICRGHFKDYREHGLFGKIKGVFWWDMRVRGDSGRGVVMKDYKAPGGRGSA